MAKFTVVSKVAGRATIEAAKHFDEGGYTVFVDDEGVKLLSILTSQVQSVAPRKSGGAMFV